MASVTVRSGPGLMQEIQAGGHTLRADEPVAVGGTNAGPDPYALLLSALGACTAMTLRLYAARKGWPRERSPRAACAWTARRAIGAARPRACTGRASPGS